MQENMTDKERLEEAVKNKHALTMRALETICYVAGAGAFGVFARWLQVMTAFNEKGLVDKSVFNLLVPLLVIGAAFLFNRFTNNIAEDRLYVSKEFCEAMFNPGRLFTIIRWVAAGIMIVGALMLVLSSETDKNVDSLRILAAVAAVAGLSYPLYLGEANYEDIERVWLLRIYALAPVVFFSVWLVVSYKQNIYNSVVWSYVLEMATIIVCANAFFRMAGFVFFAVNGKKTLFYCMLGTSLCIMSMADSRYMGQELMLFATALMLGMNTWVLISNLKKKKPRPKVETNTDGFERL